MKFQSFIILTGLTGFADAHGLLWAPSDSSEFGIRGEQALKNSDWDHLKNPNKGGQVCRGETKGKVTPVSLVDGQDMTVTLAITARHIGDCFAYILDENLQNPVLVGQSLGKHGCTGKSPDDYACAYTTQQSGLCLTKWTFKIENATRITCKNCVLQWKWTAKHNVPIEHFENCADISISGNASSNNTYPESKTRPNLVDSQATSATTEETTCLEDTATTEASRETLVPDEPAGSSSMEAAPTTAVLPGGIQQSNCSCTCYN